MNTLLLAPTASGKSFLATKNPLFVDGDEIIAKTTGWPSGAWWKQPQADEIHERNWRTLKNADVGPRVIVFNGRGYPANGWNSVVVLIPTKERIIRNLATHPHALRYGSLQERYRDIIGHNIPALRRDAQKYGYKKFEGAIADALFDKWTGQGEEGT